MQGNCRFASSTTHSLRTRGHWRRQRLGATRPVSSRLIPAPSPRRRPGRDDGVRHGTLVITRQRVVLRLVLPSIFGCQRTLNSPQAGIAYGFFLRIVQGNGAKCGHGLFHPLYILRKGKLVFDNFPWAHPINGNIGFCHKPQLLWSSTGEKRAE